MYLNVNQSISRITKRKKLNRYDRFKKSYYNKVQNGFRSIANKNKSKYTIINSSKTFKENQKNIFDRAIKILK